MKKIVLWSIVVMLLKAVRDRCVWGWDLTWLSNIGILNWWYSLPRPFDTWHTTDGLIVFTPIVVMLYSWLHKKLGVEKWTFRQWFLFILLCVGFWLAIYPILFNFLYHILFVL